MTLFNIVALVSKQAHRRQAALPPRRKASSKSSGAAPPLTLDGSPPEQATASRFEAKKKDVAASPRRVEPSAKGHRVRTPHVVALFCTGKSSQLHPLAHPGSTPARCPSGAAVWPWCADTGRRED
jgi:hypothetical protein